MEIGIEWSGEDGQTHRTTLIPTVVPPEHAAIMQRRGIIVPDWGTAFPDGALVPYEYRDWHRRYAKDRGYFWLPCPLCDQPFGGHEIGDVIPDPTKGEGCGLCICPACAAARNGGSV